ncbi:MAG: hypothetical protein APF78_03530 [Sphingomonadales bacterium BRH_c3]|nr:MAG: hypothetical protein APF78_03530 [Sphingomonadales bacterium BRH_c3]
MTDTVTYDYRDGRATITIDDGKVNVMTADLLDQFCAAVDQAQADKAMIVLRSGREKVFSAGFDVKPLASRDVEASRKLLEAGVRAILALLQHPFPVVALCQGHAYPMGAFLLLASDVRIGTQGDYRIGMNEVAIGIAVPDFALELARHRLLPSWLHRTAALGQMLLPAEALEAGFLDALVEPAMLDNAAEQVTGQLQQIDMAAHASTKQRLRAGVVAAVDTAARERLMASA